MIPPPQPEEGRGAFCSPAPDEISSQLAKILSNAEFSRSKSRRDFLSFVVEECLAGRQNLLNEIRVGEVAFGKKNFHPGEDTTVRTYAGRLRSGLDRYYATDGAEDLVIIRLPKGGYVPEFDYLTTESEIHKQEEVVAEITAPASPVPTHSGQRSWFWILVAAVIILIILIVVWALWERLSRPTIEIVTSEPIRPRRLLATSTSEGQTPVVIGTEKYAQTLITPDGKKLFALSLNDDRTITIFGALDLRFKRKVHSPVPIRTGFMSRDGRSIYFSSTEPQVVVLDTLTESWRDQVIATGEPAFDIAVTTDKRKLFLALGNAGLKRIDLVSGESRVLSPIACPIHLSLDRSSKNIFVAYECGGPGGRSGHDVVDVYDVDSEQSIYKIKDLPMVGGRPLFGPQDSVVMLESRDACVSPSYDHEGCKQVPSNPFHLWRTADRSLIGSFTLHRIGGVGSFFNQGTRAMLLGDGIAIWDWARGLTLETMVLPRGGSNWASLAPSGDRAFVSMNETDGLLVFDAEPDACVPAARGLLNYYPGEGTTDDSRGNGSLTGKSIDFAPGLRGRAFSFNGSNSFLWGQSGASYCPFCQNTWTEAFYVKVAAKGEEMTIAQSSVPSGVPVRRIFVTANQHIAVESSSGSKNDVIASREYIREGKWFHIAVVTTRNERALFIDGTLQGKHPIPLHPEGADLAPIYFGASDSKRSFFKGLIDEIVVYNRALSGVEIKTLAQSCALDTPK